MKKFTLTLLMMLLCLPMAVLADSDINLTPLPMRMTKGTGTLTLPQSFSIATNGLNDACSAEAQKFAGLFKEVTGYSITVKAEELSSLFSSTYVKILLVV